MDHEGDVVQIGPDHLNVWREKLAGVTGGEWEAVLKGDPRGQPSVMYRGLVCILSDSPDGRLAVVTANGNSCVGREWEANAEHIVLGHRLSRILADEATIEALAEELWAARYGRMAVAVWTGGEHDAARAMARACLNHLAQLALGDGT